MKSSQSNSETQNRPSLPSFGTQLPGFGVAEDFGSVAPGKSGDHATGDDGPSRMRLGTIRSLPPRPPADFTGDGPVTRTVRSVGGRQSPIARLSQSLTRSRTGGQIAESGLDSEQVALRERTGKSTWNLRIHSRNVAGDLTGFVNELPVETNEAYGLLSAFVRTDDVPEFEVLQRIGEGNMGVVYEARQTSLNRELAIKTLKPETEDAAHAQAMFVSEAVVTANLVHPNIVPVHELGRTGDGRLFYSMKKVVGTAWNKTVRTFTLEQNLEILMKVCDGVAFAHSKGVINRDLKPENVTVGNYGEVVVLDWGLAVTTNRFEKRDSVLLDFQGGAGTPPYMAPELVADDVSKVGFHSDIYLLGAMLFEILEGFPPHFLRRLWYKPYSDELRDELISLAYYNEIEKDVTNTTELMTIARKAMETDPEDRFASVIEFQEAIREYRVTGRAEELMRTISSGQDAGYDVCQNAIALYDEALRKWPNNRRAAEGDRRARLAYAQMALKRGDIDLGLQVVQDQDEPTFKTVRTKLEAAKRFRSMVKSTWVVLFFSAIALSVLSYYAADQAQNARDIALQEQSNARSAEAEAVKERDIAQQAKKDLEAANGTVIEQTKLAEEQTRLAAVKSQEAAEKAALAAQAEADAKAALDAAKMAKASLATVQSDLEAAQKARELAAVAAKEAEALAAEANRKKTDAEKLVAELEVAARESQLAKQKAELESHQNLIAAYSDLEEFGNVVNEIERMLIKRESNPFIEQWAEKYESYRERLKQKLGNTQLNLPEEKLMAGAATPDGMNLAMLTSTDGKDRELKLIRRGDADAVDPAVQIVLPNPGAGISHVSLSDDARFVCGVGRGVRQLWAVSADSARELPIAASDALSIDYLKSAFSRDGSHLYVFGRDARATVEICHLEPAQATVVMLTRLAGAVDGDYSIRDALVMPDESALIVSTKKQSCFVSPIVWTDDVPTLPENGPSSHRLKLNGLKPEVLAVSRDGSLLAAAEGRAVLCLQRLTGGDPQLVRYQELPANSSPETCALAVQMLDFSPAGTRVVAALGKGLIQVWNRQEGNLERVSDAGLYRDLYLTGHSRKDSVRWCTFLAGSEDQLVSISTDDSVRLWNLQTYSQFTQAFRDLAAALRADESRLSDAREPELGIAEQEQTIPVAMVVTQPPAAAPVQIRRGGAAFSARFSEDGERIIVGASDRAAHVYNTDTGRSAVTSVTGRRSLFFEPDKNVFEEGHIPQLSAIKFLPTKNNILLTQDYFGSISVWDASPDDNGVGFEQSRLLSEYSLSEFATSGDGRFVLAGGALLQPATGQAEPQLEHFGILWKVDSFFKEPTPREYRRLTGQHPHFAITATAMSADGSRAVTAGRRGKIVLWDVEAGSVVASIPVSHGRDQVSGAMLTGNDSFLTTGYDGRIFRWTAGDGQLAATEVPRPAGDILPDYIIRLRPDPASSRYITSEVTRLASAPGEKRTPHLVISLWTNDIPQRLTSIPIPDDDKGLAFEHDVAWSDDGQDLLFVLQGELTVFDAATLAPKVRYQQASVKSIRATFAPTVPGEPRRAAAFDGEITQLWDLSTGKRLAEFRAHADVFAADFSADRKYVLTGSDAIRMFVADEASEQYGQTLFRLGEAHQSPLVDVAFRPAKDVFQFASIDRAGVLKLWQWDPAATSVPREVFSQNAKAGADFTWDADLKPADQIVWNRDGSLLAVVQQGTLRVWNLTGAAPQELPITLPEGYECVFNSVSFSVTGTPLLAAGGVSYVTDDNERKSLGVIFRVNDAGGFVPAALLPEGHTVDDVSETTRRTGVTAIAIEPSGEVLTGGVEGTIRRWAVLSFDSETPEVAQQFGGLTLANGERAHQKAVSAISVDADGEKVTASEDGSVYLWP